MYLLGQVLERWKELLHFCLTMIEASVVLGATTFGASFVLVWVGKIYVTLWEV